MKWCQTPICFVQAWKVELVASTMAPWLLMRRVEGWERGKWMLCRNCWIQIASLVACEIAMYSPLVLERAIDGCFFELQLTVVPAMMRQNLRPSNSL